MRAGADGTRTPLRFGLAPSVLKREIFRALLAFGLYLLLYPLWLGSGGASAYGWLVPRAAAALEEVTRHFPEGSAIGEVRVRYFDFLIILVAGYAAASYGMGIRARARRTVLLGVAIFVVHVVALTVQARVLQARALWASEKVMILLPRELQAAVWLKYLLFEFGLQLAPFALIGLWVCWNVKGSAPQPGDARAGWAARRTMMVFVGAAAVLLVVSGLIVWASVRERDPRHIRAHVWFAERFLRERRWAPAEEQYRAAIEGGCRDGSAFYNLAELRRRQGDLAGCLELLRRGAEVVLDTTWRDRFRESIEEIAPAPSGPGRLPG